MQSDEATEEFEYGNSLDTILLSDTPNVRQLFVISLTMYLVPLILFILKSAAVSKEDVGEAVYAFCLSVTFGVVAPEADKYIVEFPTFFIA